MNEKMIPEGIEELVEYITRTNKELSVQYDKIRKAVCQFSEMLPQLHIAVDGEPFYSEVDPPDTINYFLSFFRSEFRIGKMLNEDYDGALYLSPSDAPIRVLAAITPDVLKTFLRKVAEKLSNQTKKYEKVAKLAEKISQSIS